MKSKSPHVKSYYMKEFSFGPSPINRDSQREQRRLRRLLVDQGAARHRLWLLDPEHLQDRRDEDG